MDRMEVNQPTRRSPAAHYRLAQPDPNRAERRALAREGLTNREIGERLYVSRRTVETHLSHVFSKLGLASRRQLMLTSVPLSA